MSVRACLHCLKPTPSWEEQHCAECVMAYEAIRAHREPPRDAQIEHLRRELQGARDKLAAASRVNRLRTVRDDMAAMLKHAQAEYEAAAATSGVEP